MNVATKTVRCCVICSECGDCYTHTLYELQDLMKAIHIEIADWGKSMAQKIYWGYACRCISDQAVDTLILLQETIRRYYDTLVTKTMGCLCDIEFQRIKEHVGKLIDLPKCRMSKEETIRYDYSQYERWVALNPHCVAFDAWERGLIACAAPTFLISSTKEERPIRTLYAIASKDESKCVMKLLAFAHKASCEFVVTAAAKNQAKCRAELVVLVKKFPTCDLSFDVYSKLLDCNLSFQVVSTVLGCGGRFSLDKRGEPMLKIGARVSKVKDVIKLAGGTWQDMDQEEFNSIYG